MDDRAETPEAILAQIRAEARLRPDPLPRDDDDRLDPDPDDRHLNRLIERFPSARLRAAIKPRLAHLGDADGFVVLRLLEAQLDPALAEDLALALRTQPELAADRAWEALAILEGAGAFERFPDLLERWDELNDAIDPDLANDGLARQLEEDPGGSWVALEGLGTIDPGTRAEIVASLAEASPGPGLVAFLRILTFSHDDQTRRAALEAIFDPARLDGHHAHAWAELARDHFDPAVRARARRRLGIGGADDRAIDAQINAALDHPARPRPKLIGSLVSGVDGTGRGSVVLVARDRSEWVAADFTCDVARGIVAVAGIVAADASLGAGFCDEVAARRPGAVLVEDDLDLAVALLSRSWLRSGPSASPALRYWIERTIGPDFEPTATEAGEAFDPDEVAASALTPLAEASWSILDACPSWADRSSLTFDLAEAMILRSGASPPDPRRDAGSYRFLFEHHLSTRMDHYRRLLLWMASLWRTTQPGGDDDLARSAVALAWQLADPQNAVPGHPFILALSTLSLAAAQTDLRHGRDPRQIDLDR